MAARGPLLGILLAIAAAGAAQAQGGNMEPGSFAWGENVGWINFAPSRGPGVTVGDSSVIGLAWGENVGWIDLAPATAGVVNDGTGRLSGFAWGENVGWIDFAPTGAGVTIDCKGRFAGRAWGENIGWVTFGSTTAVDFGVATFFRPPPPRGDINGDCTVNVDDLNLVLAARNTPASGPGDPRDLDGDGTITALDARILTTLCSKPRCAR